MGSSSGIEVRIFFEGVVESTRWLQRSALFEGVDWVDVAWDVDGNKRYDMSSMRTARRFSLATRPITLAVMPTHDPAFGIGVFFQRFP